MSYARGTMCLGCSDSKSNRIFVLRPYYMVDRGRITKKISLFFGASQQTQIEYTAKISVNLILLLDSL